MSFFVTLLQLVNPSSNPRGLSWIRFALFFCLSPPAHQSFRNPRESSWSRFALFLCLFLPSHHAILQVIQEDLLGVLSLWFYVSHLQRLDPSGNPRRPSWSRFTFFFGLSPFTYQPFKLRNQRGPSWSHFAFPINA